MASVLENAVTAPTSVVPSLPEMNSVDKKEPNISNVWTMNNFKNEKIDSQKKGLSKNCMNLELKAFKTTWATERNHQNSDDSDEKDEEQPEAASPAPSTPDKETTSPHHARRPMNAFLIFCKKHRPIVRQKFPNLENRGVTRILGEWWALLEAADKNSYTNLAKEYKDAFFSANPGFKWYKLPAPPLRTLSSRPATVQKITSPLSSPTQTSASSNAEFNPGKLADESQLGSLTSLMNLNSEKVKSEHPTTPDVFSYNIEDLKRSDYYMRNNNNIDNKYDVDFKDLLATPLGNEVDKKQAHPKPLKKRNREFFHDNNNQSVVRNIFNTTSNELEPGHLANGYSDSNNMTKQDLVNKVVDRMFLKNEEKNHVPVRNGMGTHKRGKETRKSGRSCKGKRYAEFMVEGKLLGSRHSKRLTQGGRPDINQKFENELNTKMETTQKTETITPKLDLENTIKRLAARTNIKLEELEQEAEPNTANNNNNNNIESSTRSRTESECSDDSMTNKMQSYFNLDLRIAELPSLSYETYLQRKKDSKKRKPARGNRSETGEPASKMAKVAAESSPVGSKKRKNKNNITRLEKPAQAEFPADLSNDPLSGLATLAEVAANTEKIN